MPCRSAPAHGLRYWRLGPAARALRTGREQWHLTVLLTYGHER